MMRFGALNQKAILRLALLALGLIVALIAGGGYWLNREVKRPHAHKAAQKIITIEPGKRSGKPCIRGLRITVYDVLEYLASGMSHAEVLQEFPYLTEEDIRACLAYAADRERKLKISKA